MCRLKKRTSIRQKLIRFDHSKLNDEHVSSVYCREVANNLSADNINYSNLASAVMKASTSVLPKRERAQPDWFRANEHVIVPLIEARNSAMAEVYARRTRTKT